MSSLRDWLSECFVGSGSGLPGEKHTGVHRKMRVCNIHPFFLIFNPLSIFFLIISNVVTIVKVNATVKRGHVAFSLTKRGVAFSLTREFPSWRRFVEKGPGEWASPRGGVRFGMTTPKQERSCHVALDQQRAYQDRTLAERRPQLSGDRGFRGESEVNDCPGSMERVMSHMGILFRKSFNNIPSITLFETIYGKEVLNKLGVSPIAPQDVTLTPDLLLKKQFQNRIALKHCKYFQ